ncbi:hypothetical protein K1T73_03400 [Roseovarius sp. SCSIO 43702]|uniref:hypothetical protein n=1 Tax=Roseovarius sp. SCSIO 43702 TaxID=2823043 RepID=UPI001C72B3BD|nr:hypothetical protein [Roseovarius sp. SCSIO 43702]QYX57458.1 hypothetical protein K1T73_03400 [Roseovarius sp. SCSIO 43702]
MWARVFGIVGLVMALALAPAAMAQDAEVPPEVIEECHTLIKGYDEMPGCLKGGTIGYRMLAMAVEEDMYGATGAEVVRICRETNDGSYAAWLCFRTAVEKAVEIRGMIGAAQMTDRCYRELSDPARQRRLTDAAATLRRAVAGDGYWGGMTTYRAFRGCGAEPEPDAASETGGHRHDHAVEDATGGYTREACRAYGEVEAAIRAREASELRAVLTELRGLPEDERLDALTRYGVSEPSVDVLRDELSGDEALGAAMVLMGFLRESHPGVFADAMAAAGQETGPVADAARAGVLDLLMGGVLDSYRTACPG